MVRNEEPHMPDPGDPSKRPCADCGRPMYWTEAAVQLPDSLVGTSLGVEQSPAFVDAYRCAIGHTSKQCPLCGSYDTAAWAEGDPPRHYHVICAACGNDSVVDA